MADNNRIIPCFTRENYEQAGYTIVENTNGTVNVFNNNGVPTTDHETKSCCEALGYNFNLDIQKCMWGALDGENDGDGTVIGENCVFEPFRVVINPEENGSAIFESDINDTCCLNISFDYLFNFECDVLENFIKKATAPQGPKKGEVEKVALESVINDKEVECSRLNELISAEESLEIPYVITCEDTNVKYCLNETGLKIWKNFLSDDNYTTWIASFGSDTNTYSCKNVNSFINSKPPNVVWYSTTCNYSIYDKLESNNKLQTYKTQESECKVEINKLSVKLGGVSEEVIDASIDCQSYIDLFESLDISFNLEKLNQTNGRLETVYSESIFNIPEGGLSDYIVNNVGSTGLLIEGSCNNMRPTIQGELNQQYEDIHGDLPKNIYAIFKDWFDTCWLRYEREICDPNVIEALTNENINISILVNNSCIDFSILLDRIKIQKNCDKVNNVETYISEAPKFEFEKVSDNKKSWLANKGRVERDYKLKYRGTEYFSNEQRLTINSKEIDLNLSPARAVEQDVWCYISDNNCILEGCNNDEPFQPFFCPDGFQFDGGDNTACIMSAVTNTIQFGNIYTADTAYNFNRVNHYGLRGTIFIEDEVTNLAWPIYWTGTPVNTWVGPYYNVDYLTDSSGTTINATGFGTEYKQGNILRWSSPAAFSGFYSQFGSSESPTVNGVPNPNLLWGGTPGLNSMVMAGRLFNAGVWVKGTGINNQYFNNKWLGFSECINLTDSGIYNIGFGGDDKVRVKVNGEWLINPDISPTRVIGVDSGFDTFRPNTRFTQAYVVAPITLFKGKNVIEIEGYNGTAGNPAGFAMEIYSASTSQLKAMTGVTELDNVTIFSTKDFIGEEFNVVGNEGYFCPVTYALDTCLPEPFQCLQINRIASIETEQKICGCDGDPLVIESFSGTPIQLPIITKSGSTLNCEDIYNLYTGNTKIDIIDSEYRQIYTIGTKTPISFNGYYISEENDGGIGVYDVNWLENVSETYESLTDLVNEECCNIISDIFAEDIVLNNQNVDIYPSVSWDKNIKKCVTPKCGDDGCANIDDLLTTEISEFDTVREFSSVLISELIDVKNRQTINSYPTLRMLYERYNNHALEYCEIESSKFDYFDMDNFGRTVGDYWVDLIEQVIPATSLWNSTYEYRNTIFDQQKHQYKRTSLFNCVDPSGDFPTLPIGSDNNVEVILETLQSSNSGVTSTEECSGVWVMQNTCGTEYLGTVTVLGNSTQSSKQNIKSISEISTLDAQ